MKKAKDYINTNDFEGCLKRFNNTTKNWKNHWFEALVVIYQSSKEWAKKYILDPIKKTVILVTRYFIELNSYIFWNEFETYKNKGGVYVVELYDENGEKKYTKVGKAKNFLNRFNSYKRENKYSNWIKCVKVAQLYLNEDEDDSLTLENNLRKLFKKYDIEGYVKNDTFVNIEWNEELKKKSDSIVQLTENFLATL